MSPRVSILLALLILCGHIGFAQTAEKNSGGDPEQAVRVCVAATINRSNSQVTPTWGRDQLVRELQHLRKDRKSSVVLEAISLEAMEREDASAESEKKDCQYFVLTTLLNPGRGPGISGGPDGTQRSPVLLGNTTPGKTLTVNFTLVEVSSAGIVADGTSAAPVEDKNDIRAANDAMQFVAHRIASELRTKSVPRID